MKRIQTFVVAAALLLSSYASAATPLLLYLMDQASSGTTPTTINDTSTGTALNLTITYGTGSWTSITSGKGMTFSATSGAVSGSLSGTKVATATSGATQATWEVVADTSSYTGFNDIAGLQNTSFDDWFSLITGSSGVNEVGVTGGGGTVWYDVTPGLHRFQAVYDSTQATNTNRILLYVDGAAATVDSSPFAPTYPAQNTAIDTGFTNYANNRVAIGCLVSAGTQSYVGPIYYAALYAAALTSGDATSHNTALSATNGNDANPNGVASTSYNALFFASQRSWSPPPCMVTSGAGSRYPVYVQDGPLLLRAALPIATTTSFSECTL